jgi:DNA-binding NarL/FixJ family response regulator
LSRGGIDVVLLDLFLPDSSGIETFVRAHDHSPEVPIVMLTGVDVESVAIDAMRRGAQDYLIKGRVDGQLVARAIRYAIERKLALQERERLIVDLHR